MMPDNAIQREGTNRTEAKVNLENLHSLKTVVGNQSTVLGQTGQALRTESLTRREAAREPLSLVLTRCCSHSTKAEHELPAREPPDFDGMNSKHIINGK